MQCKCTIKSGFQENMQNCSLVLLEESQNDRFGERACFRTHPRWRRHAIVAGGAQTDQAMEGANESIDQRVVDEKMMSLYVL